MRVAAIALGLALSACGPSRDYPPGVGEWSVSGEQLVCGAGGDLVVYAQPAGIATCTWDCVPQRDGPAISLQLEFLLSSGTWSLLREVVGPAHCPLS